MNRIRAMILLILQGLLGSFSHAEVVTDGTVGPGRALQGPDYAITHDLGQQEGGNLFHSFSSFNLNRTESATFTGPSTVENIISRVTGGNASTIDGLLRSDMQGADMYFMNPSGIMFGPHAQVDITGSFHVTTADYLKLGENGRFDAINPSDSVLTTAAPSAFGFLNDTPASISFEGAGSDEADSNYGMKGIEVPEGETLSVIGGDITFTSGLLFDEYKVESRLKAPGGRINVASVEHSGEVVTAESGLDVEAGAGRGDITISEGSYATVTGQGAGSIYIHGGRFIIDGSNSSLNANSLGDLAGAGGGIFIDAEELTITQGGQICSSTEASTEGVDKGGNIAVRASESIYITGQDSGIYNNAFSKGNGGGISISTPSLSMDNKGRIQAKTDNEGNAGSISLEVDAVNLTGGAQIRADSMGTGKGGSISVNAAESVSISGVGSSSSGDESGLFSNAYSSGDGGDLSISTPLLSMDNKGRIWAQTDNEGNAGSISLEVDTMNLTDGARIRNDSIGEGKGGNITVNASKSVSVSGFDRSGLFTSAQKSGDGGDLSISTPLLSMDNNGAMEVITVNEGNAGSISLEVDALSLTDGAHISTSSWGAGKGGDMTVNASESVSISGVDSSGHNSGLYNNAHRSGNGGEVSISTPLLSMDNEGIIQADTWSIGNAGSISLKKVDRLTLTGGAQISTSSSGAGNGGSISVNASESVSISGIGISGRKSGLYNDAYSSGNGGEVSISTPSLSMDNKGHIQAMTDNKGNAGSISLKKVDTVNLTGGAQIRADSMGTGKGGSISVNAAESVSISGVGSSSSGDESGLFSNAYSSGDGGEISISTPSLSMDNKGHIWAATTNKGNAGSISLEKTDTVSLTGGARIRADSWGTGKGGSISVNAAESVSISGVGSSSSGDESGLFSNAYSIGDGGEVSISTPSLSMDNKGRIQAKTDNKGNAGSIFLKKADTVNITGGAQISTSSWGAGKGGNITVNAPESVSISGFDSDGNKSGLFNIAYSIGDGGEISISTPSLNMDNEARIWASTTKEAEGNAGSIFLKKADTVNITGGAQISTSSWGAGKGGNITVNAPESVSISGFDSDGNKSGLFNIAYSIGDGGEISISTPSLNMDNEARIWAATTNKGNAGSISLEKTDTVNLTGGARIRADSWGTGKGGSITLNAAESVSISGIGSDGSWSGLFSNAYSIGDGGKISISTPSLNMDNEAQIWASTTEEAEGNAGSIFVKVDTMNLTGGAQINSSSWGEGKGGKITVTASEGISISGSRSEGELSGLFNHASGSGNAGEVFIFTPSLIMDQEAVIQAGTRWSTGNAGSISLEVDTLTLTGGALISAISIGDGKGGNITVNATESISISGFDSDGNESGLFNNAYKKGNAGAISLATHFLSMDNKGTIEAKTEDTGTAGNITVKAEKIRLTNSASINTESTGTGKAGDISINADDAVRLQNSSITTATDNADGGNIQLHAQYMLDLIESDITATVKGGTGNGGNITIDPVFVILDNSNIIANAEKGRGGNISITANHLIVSPDSVVSASSELGVDGNVVINSPAMDISESLTALSSSFLNTEALSPEQCATREEELSTFIVKGRNGLPPRPDSLLMSP